AVRFLVAATEGQRRSLPDDPEAVAALARALDGLPLALEQIAAWVRAEHCSFADALAAITAEDTAVLAWYDPRELRYPLPVAAVWERALEPLGAAEHFLLRFLAWLAPAPAPDFLVQALSVVWQDQEGSPPDFVGLARGLCERSLLTARSDRAFLLHRLSLELERRRTPRPERFLWDSRVAEVLSTVVPKDVVDVRTWPRIVLLQPHASDLFLRTEPLAPTSAVGAGDTPIAAHLSRLLTQFGSFLHARAELSAAEPLLRRALAIDEQNYGPDDPTVAIDLNNLAQLLQDTNRLEEAEPLLRRALAIVEKTLGPEHPELAAALNNLALLLKATHRLEYAEPLLRRALEIDEQSYGPEHPEVAPALNNLAQLLQDTDRLEDAEPLMRRALAIDEQSYGPEHPRVAIRLNNLATLLQATHRLEEAEPLMRRALAIVEKTLGEEHPNVAIALNNLAALLQDTNRLDLAEPLMRRALAIDEESYGPEHPTVARDLNNLAQLLNASASKRLQEAESLS
ncbi:MAG: tetratricopeptide repeat protein, partial [bacterium]